MTVATLPPAPFANPVDRSAEQRMVLRAVPWETYTQIGEALDRRRDVRLVYHGGTLTLMVKSREHELFAERLGYFVAWVAMAIGRPCEPCGQMTLRRKDLDAGVEGDKTFYVGPNADKMRGVREVNLEIDPLPDLAMEVELTHPADEALATYAKLGVPEVWRFDAVRWTLTFLRRQDDGQYIASPQSVAFPELSPQHVIDQLKRAAEAGTTAWLTGLADWARTTLRP